MQYETRVPTTRPDLADVLRGYVLGRVVIEASKPSKWAARHQESPGARGCGARPQLRADALHPATEDNDGPHSLGTAALQ